MLATHLLRVAVLQLSIAGCWPYLAPTDPVVEPLRLQPRKRPRATCAKLETMSSLVPQVPDLEAACGHHIIDGDRYYCSWNEMAYHAGNLRHWIDTAVSRCADEAAK